MERELKQMFETKGPEMSVPPTLSPQLRKRILRQRMVTGGLVATAAFALVFGGLAMGSAIWTDAAPVRPAGPRPAPAAPGTLAYALDGDIYVADQDGSNAVKIADGRSADNCYGWGGEYWAEGSMWSPDGRYVAYRRYTDCGGSEEPLPRNVVISDAEGNVVATFPAQGWDIAWSPDSTRVAVWDDYFETKFTIGVYGLDGARLTQVTMPAGWEPSGDHDPVWMPDGSSLTVDDLKVPLDGGTQQGLPWNPTAFAYSPDGSQVAYVDQRSLVVAQSDGSEPRKVFGDWASDPKWSPTGERIAFTTHGDGREFSELRVLHLATGSVTLVTEAERGSWLLPSGFSPQGERLLFSRTEGGGEGESSLWSISIDGSDARLVVGGTNQGDWQ